jgi:type IV secretion system protein VirB6
MSAQNSSFYAMQANMHTTVTALLILYIMFNAMTIFLGGMTDKKSIAMFIIKFVLVTYFSIGINVAEDGKAYSGMIDIIFPFLFTAVNEIASWISNASPSGLCNFTASDYAGGINYSLWDSIDCRTITYVGISGFADLYSWLRESGQIASSSNFAIINYSIPPYFPLLVAGIWTGNLSLVMLALSFPILVILIGAYIVQSFVVCIIFITILGMLATLFVPMALFSYTYRYFEGWMKILFSCMLQPTVSVTFAVLVFSIYDYGFYGTCTYRKLNITMPDPLGSTLISFFIDTTNTDANCTKTLGWWMSDKLDFSKLPGNTVSLADLNLARNGCGANSSVMCGAVSSFNTMAISGATSIAVDTGKVAIDTIQGLGNYLSSGNFITVPTAPLEGFFQIVGAMVVAIFAIYIGKQASDEIADFAAGLTAGVSFKSMTFSPKKGFDAIMSAASKSSTKGKAAKLPSKGSVGDQKQANNKLSTGGKDSVNSNKNADKSSSDQTHT